MMNLARSWCRPTLFVMLAMMAVPACEYGQGERDGRTAYRMSVTTPPAPVDMAGDLVPSAHA
jgi:hypothetical protein